MMLLPAPSLLMPSSSSSSQPWHGARWYVLSQKARHCRVSTFRQLPFNAETDGGLARVSRLTTKIEVPATVGCVCLARPRPSLRSGLFSSIVFSSTCSQTEIFVSPGVKLFFTDHLTCIFLVACLHRHLQDVADIMNGVNFTVY